MKRMRNALFLFIYPNLKPGDRADKESLKDLSVAIPDSAEFISVCSVDGCAVVKDASEARRLAAALLMAADEFEANKIALSLKVTS